MNQHKFSMKEKKQEERKNTKEYFAFAKQIKKWKQVRNTFFNQKREGACVFFLKKKKFSTMLFDK